MTDQVKPQPLLSDEEIEEMLELSRESMDAHKLARSLAKACAQAKLAALPRSEPKEAGVLVLEAAYKAVQDAHLAKYIAEQEAAPAKSAPDAVAQVLASSLGATESRWGEAKGNAEGTAPVKTEAEGGWMPIETAPKDGTWVLVTGWNHGKKGTERHQAVVRWCEECNGWTDEQDDGDEPKALAFLTHWRPLPAPPALGDL